MLFSFTFIDQIADMNEQCVDKTSKRQFVFGPTSADMKIVEFTAHRIFYVRIKLQ